MRVDAMLEKARKSYVDMFNILSAVRLGTIRTSTNDFMFAYFVAKEWQNWFKNPQADGCPLEDKNMDYSSQLDTVEWLIDQFEEVLLADFLAVDEVFENLNPNLLENADAPATEAAKTYFETLELVARLYNDRIGMPQYLKKLGK